MPDDGFYLNMLSKRDAVDASTGQCYSQVCSKLGYYNNPALQVAVDGKKGPLTEAAMSAAPDPSIPAARDGFFIFRGAYMKAFEDGALLLKLVKDIGTTMGDKTDEVDEKMKSFGAKNHAALRAAYWYIDKKFISRFPPSQQVSFSVDCLMFGSWQCNSRNVVGMHLVALACMMDVKQFVPFLPAELAKHPVVMGPPFKGFLEKKAIALAINPGAKVAGGAGAGVAKTVDKAAKGAKDDKKGAKDDKKGAKDDKKGAKDDKKGAKDDKKKGAKDDKKGAKDDKKKGGKDDKKKGGKK